MMGQSYENVWFPQTLVGTAGELIVGGVGLGYHRGEPEKQNHLGPVHAWFGMVMGVVEHGNGRYILSTLRIIENLGKDPVADKILFNLIEWTTAAADQHADSKTDSCSAES
jgi:beta-galactosidase